MAVIEKARRLFQESGLVFPMVPSVLAKQLTEQDTWLFASCHLTASPYDLHYYVTEFDGPDIGDFAILSHSGHGVNSYAIQYYLGNGPLRLFLHLGWGGAYMDTDACASQIRECFSLSDQIVSATPSIEDRLQNSRLIIVGSDFYGSYWSAPGIPPTDKQKPPIEVSGMLRDVIEWINNPD